MCVTHRRCVRGWAMANGLAFQALEAPTGSFGPFTPSDLRPSRRLSLALAFAVAGYFEIAESKARAIAAEVAAAVSTWRTVAGRHGIPRQEIDRMASAFEHRDLEIARSR